MRVHVGSQNPVKGEAVRNIFERVFQQPIELYQFSVKREAPAQPWDAATVQGAIERARQALPEADYGVGIEAGLLWNETLHTHFDVQYCAIIDSHGKVTVGHGAGFVYPPRVLAQVKQGRAVGEVMSELTGVEKLGQKMGAIGFLSRGLLTRTQLTEQAVLMALLPRIRSDLYD